MTTEGSILVDTSAWIEALRPSGNAQIRARVAEVLAAGHAVTTPLVVMEILIGTNAEEQYRDLQEDLLGLRLLPIDAVIWQQATRLGFDLRRAGLSIPTTDLLIAAVAVANDATVLHADRHFDLVATRSALKVESVLALLTAD